jgi:hypothetical protein
MFLENEGKRERDMGMNQGMNEGATRMRNSERDSRRGKQKEKSEESETTVSFFVHLLIIRAKPSMNSIESLLVYSHSYTSMIIVKFLSVVLLLHCK